MPSIVNTWPRLVKSGELIPEAFKEKFDAILNSAAGFPYTVFLPPDRWGFRRTSPKLLGLVQRKDTKTYQLFVIEKQKKEIQVSYYDLNDVYCLERGKSLLYSWFKVHVGAREPVFARIEFNTVMERLFVPITDAIRETIGGWGDGDSSPELKQEQAKFDFLNRLNYKYMNFGKQSILAGEKVSRILYQPEIWEQFAHWFRRYISPSHIAILTSQELIIIKEDEKFKGHMTYGGIWFYIPLSKIAGLTVINTTPTRSQKIEYITLAVNLLNGQDLSLKYAQTQQDELNALQQDMKTSQDKIKER